MWTWSSAAIQQLPQQKTAALLPPQKKAHDKKRKNNTQTSLELSWTAPHLKSLSRAATFQFTKLVKIAISALSAEYVDGLLRYSKMELGKRNSYTHTQNLTRNDYVAGIKNDLKIREA